MGTAGRSTGQRRGAGGGIFLAFIPWIAFSIIANHDSLVAAAIVALGAAIVIAAPATLAGRPKIIEIGAVATFAVFTVLALVADPAEGDWLTNYARAVAAAVLAAIALGSLLWTPFTEQYAREQVPREYWGSERFRRVNRELTLMWGLVFAALIPCHIIAGAIDTRRSNTIFNWVIPIVLVVLAVKRTARVTDDAHHTAPGDSGAATTEQEG